MTAIRCILLACAISFSGTVFAAAPEAKNERVEQPMYMSETTQFELNLPAEKAVYLFSAEGEKYWVKDWEPSLPKGDGFQKNDVFYVNSYPGKPVYIVLEFDDKNYRVHLAEMIPNISAGTLEVTLTPTDKDSSIVQLTYHLSALSPEGEEYIRGFKENYDEAMLTWKHDIERNDDKIQSWLKTRF